MKKKAYIIIDVGTGNLRVAVAATNADILGIARADIIYNRDDSYPDALYFDPAQLWDSILDLTKQALRDSGPVEILALTATSQREGIVLIDLDGESLLGLPNIDHRGTEWVEEIRDKQVVYQLTGRRPSSLFSAFKLKGIQHRKTDIWEKCSTFLSISDWVEYMLSGIVHYEHSQASETLLYDVNAKNWSDELLSLFHWETNFLPKLTHSGTVLGTILMQQAAEIGLPSSAKVIVGGGDTQLAVLGTQAQTDDVVIVSGTTTPVIKLSNTYILDDKQRTWTGRHVDQDSFMIETNAGVTGLNFQRLKEIFYPNEGYDVIEKELTLLKNHQSCVASLGSLVAGENGGMTRGGFIFDVPVSQEISRAGFIYAALWDIACCIKENYDSLKQTSPHDKDYIWACGGGFQSVLLRDFISALTKKDVYVRNGFEQSSVIGGVIICNKSLGEDGIMSSSFEKSSANPKENYLSHYQNWKLNREVIKTTFN